VIAVKEVESREQAGDDGDEPCDDDELHHFYLVLAASLR
jgi:hypothetical protein